MKARRLGARRKTQLVALALVTVLSSRCALLYRSAESVPEATYATEELAEDVLIEIAIREFDPGVVPETAAGDWDTSPGIRSAEARFLPFQLKQTLQNTGQWGPVWVTPGPADAVDVAITGEIVESNGERVAVEIDATDSSGDRWISKTYRITLSADSYAADSIDQDPYAALFRLVANDLVEARNERSDAELRKLRQISQLRFAQSVAPDAFKSYLSQQSGHYSLARLPAMNDPMVDRVLRLREREYLFLDTINDHYARLAQDMAEPYRNWRQFSREEAEAYREVRNEAVMSALAGVAVLVGGVLLGQQINSSVPSQVGAAGGAVAISSAIGKYLEAKIHTTALEELAASFQSEVAPMVVAIEDTTVRLNGTAQEQYAEWRRLLRKLYEAETGFKAEVEMYVDESEVEDKAAKPVLRDDL